MERHIYTLQINNEWGEEGEGSSRNMYEGPIDKDNGEGLNMGIWGWMEGESNGRKMETTIIEQ